MIRKQGKIKLGKYELEWKKDTMFDIPCWFVWFDEIGYWRPDAYWGNLGMNFDKTLLRALFGLVKDVRFNLRFERAPHPVENNERITNDRLEI